MLPVRIAHQHHQREDLRVPVVLVRYPERAHHPPPALVVRRRLRLRRQEEDHQEEAYAQVINEK